MPPRGHSISPSIDTPCDCKRSLQASNLGGGDGERQMKPSIAVAWRDRASGKNRRGRGRVLWKKKQDLSARYLQRSKPLLALFFRCGSDVGSQAKYTFTAMLTGTNDDESSSGKLLTASTFGFACRPCLLLAQSRHTQCADECPLLGESGGRPTAACQSRFMSTRPNPPFLSAA
jgi:hypothetical protein